MKVYWAYPILRSEESYYVLSDHFRRALMRHGIEVVPVPAGYFDQSMGWMGAAAFPDLGAVPTIVAGTAGFMTLRVGRCWGFSMYESTRLPNNWAPILVAHCERLIVPSLWCKEIFEKALQRNTTGTLCDVPMMVEMHIVPLGVDPAEFPYIDRPKRDTYTFLALADRSNRKGFDLVHRAFYEVFGGPQETPDVRLIYKMIETPQSILWWQSQFQYRDDGGRAAPDRRVRTWRENVRSMADVYALADCFVFPSRGEGFGLPPREAAATGLPVIATDATGMAGDVENWGMPLSWTFGPASSPYDGEWAEPNFGELCAAMRWCYDHRDRAKAGAREASAYIHANQTWYQAAGELVKLLREVEGI